MRFRYLAFVVFFFLVSCSFSSSPSIKENLSEPTGVTPSVPFSSTSYPVDAVKETQEPTPTTDPSLGQVTGELYLNGKPVNEAVLFLANIAKNDQGQDSVVMVDLNTKLRASTSNEGKFLFVNIPKNHYALVLVEFPNSYLLMKPGTQDSITLNVVEGKTEDLGRLDYDNLPVRQDK